MTSKNVKFLNYWWDQTSVIDPASATEDYFKVTYDSQGRYVLVERYSALHDLLSRDKFIWKDSLVSRVEVYDPETDALEKYIDYEYDEHSEVQARNHYLPNGKLIRREPV